MSGVAAHFLFLLLIVTALGGCANIVPPTGGEKDVTPPKLRSITPADSQRNTRIKKLELGFDEYITINDVAAQVHISPLLSIPLTVTATTKRVTVVIPDSLLQDETTYRITFGNAVRDLHEGNVWEGKGYTFSTGGHFDSLSLAGTVYNAHTGLRDSAMQVMLYASGDGDSAVVRHSPMYVVRTDAAGNFLLQGLPARSFRVYALRDANANLTFDGGAEWIGFYDSVVTPTPAGRADIILRAFPETLSDTAAPGSDLQRLGFRAGSRTVATPIPPGRYVIGADTTDSKRRTQELTAPLRISFGRKPAAGITEGKIFLSADSAGATVEVPFRASAADTTGLQYHIITPWKEDALYTLRLQKGFAKDSGGADLLPGRYTFRTKRDEDYGKLRVHLPARFYGRGHILQVSNERDTVYEQAVTDTIVNLPRIPPGVYRLRIIEDRNQNGRWDAGDLFLRRQPELVLPYGDAINLKAGWEQQIDFEEPRKRALDNAFDKR